MAARRPVTARPNWSNCASTSTIRCSCEMFVEAIADAALTLPAELRQDARLVFTAHSIPLAARSRCGTDLYARQVAYASRLVATEAGYGDYDQVWQSRSGPPQVPWLEPDAADHLSALADAGAKAVIVCPIGFVADHIEVVWDLDNELRELAQQRGVAFARAATPNADRRFARLAVDLIEELRDGREPSRFEAPQEVGSPSAERVFDQRGAVHPGVRETLAPGRLQDGADRRQPGRAHDRRQWSQRLVGDLRLR